MKLFAQCGFGLGDKVQDALDKSLLDGVIFGCKDISPDNLNQKATSLISSNKKFEVLIDPQFYVTLQANNPNVNPGKLEDWSFFKANRRSQFESNDKIDSAIEEVLKTENNSIATSLIAPNIYISKSFDSIEGLIAKNFIRRSKAIASKVNRNKPVYASLLVTKEAFLQKSEFEDFLNDITALENPPDGFYLIVSTSTSGAIEELYHSEILSNWMLLNHVLSINGFKVINGYSDLFTPILGVVGAYAGAMGWWGTTQIFSMERFVKSSGKPMSQPLKKYFSIPILKRINHRQLMSCQEYNPGVLLNKSKYDKPFLSDPDQLSRTDEILQLWDAIRNMNDIFIKDDIIESIQHIVNHTLEAEKHLAQFGSLINSDSDYLEELRGGMQLFRTKANL